MDEENYKLLLEKQEEFKVQLESLAVKIKEVTEFNRTLLNSHGSPSKVQDEEKEKEEIWKQLKEGLQHGSHK